MVEKEDVEALQRQKREMASMKNKWRGLMKPVPTMNIMV